MSWFLQIFLRRKIYNELAEEMRQHLEEKAEQIMRLDGVSRAEALRPRRGPSAIMLQSSNAAAKSGNGRRWNPSGQTYALHCARCARLPASR